MKKLLLCLTSAIFVASCFEELEAGDSGEPEKKDATSSLVLFGKENISDDIKMADSMKSAFDNARSKFSSAETAIMKYATDLRVFSGHEEVALIPILSSIIALDARCFDTVSRAFALLKEGLENIKSSGKDVKGKKEVAGRKLIQQAAQLLKSMYVFRIMLNSIMSYCIQYEANIRSKNTAKKDKSKIFGAIHGNDIKKQLEPLRELCEKGKKKLIGKDTKGLRDATEVCGGYVDDLTNGSDTEMKEPLKNLEESMEHLFAIVGMCGKYIETIGAAASVTNDFSNHVDKLASLNQECNDDDKNALKKHSESRKRASHGK
ncbi:hypothetical protein FACS189449_05140 [Alphaproteobacteria bacterium]|nr:hypothetical protein FACS189449_05140 [Alphaproteobacteria bacterium]